MKDAVEAAVITAGVSLTASVISGWMSLKGFDKAKKNTREMQDLKGSIDRDLERLRATLAHGQTISATHWSAEFTAYQRMWKRLVEVRSLKDKLVNREGELHQIGLPKEYLSSEERLQHRKGVVQRLLAAANDLLSAIHDNAPFYPAAIRGAANEAHQAAFRLVQVNLRAIAKALTGDGYVQTEAFRSAGEAILPELFESIDKVESLIRQRLEAVQVLGPGERLRAKDQSF